MKEEEERRVDKWKRQKDEVMHERKKTRKVDRRMEKETEET